MTALAGGTASSPDVSHHDIIDMAHGLKRLLLACAAAAAMAAIAGRAAAARRGVPGLSPAGRTPCSGLP